MAGLGFIQANPISQVNACPASFALSSFKGSGFLTSKGGQFLMKPNTTAYINITYTEMSISPNTVNANSSTYFGPIQLLKVSGSNALSIEASSVGIKGGSISVSILGNTSLSVIYEISASASAQQGTYLMHLWSACPGPLLTVGNTLYDGPYSSGVFN